MSEWQVEFTAINGSPLPTPEGVVITPLWYGDQAQGGPDMAELQADGRGAALWSLLLLLGRRIVIRNRVQRRVWSGLLEECILNLGGLQVGLTLKGMFNRVTVMYTTEDASGVAVRATTDWVEDSESIARYGYRELRFSMADVSQEQAEAKRDTLLATLSKPLPIVRMFQGGIPTATIRAVGLMSTLGLRYYEQVSGLEEHTTGGQEQILGQGLTSSTIGFTEDGRIHDSNNQLVHLSADQNIQVSGSTGNDGTVLLDGTGREGETLVSTDIEFDPSDDINNKSDNPTLGFLSENDIITISGSPANSGIRRVTSGGAGHITVEIPPNIVFEAVGPSITLAQAGSIRTIAAFTNEMPGASTTLTVHGQKVAQSFALAANVSWTVNQIAIRVRKQGAPTDNVKVELCVDTAGNPGTVLASATVAAADLKTKMDWVAFDFGNTQTISYGSTYWLVVSRTGANDIDDYFVVDVDEDLGYSRGSLKLWTGAAWTTRVTDADLPFRVTGAWETTKQVEEIYNTCGQFFDGLDLIDSSGISSLQYRDGEGTGLDEMVALLETGNDQGQRLLATVTVENILRIQVQPASSDDNLLLSSEGTLRDVGGQPLPEGVLPAGRWVRLADVPGNVDALAGLANIFIERAEYHTEDGNLRLEPLGTPSPWDIGGVVQG